MFNRANPSSRLSILIALLSAAAAPAATQTPPIDPLDNFTPISQVQRLTYKMGRPIGGATNTNGLRGAPARVYDNTGTTSLFIGEAQFHRAGDDGSFASETSPGPGAAITSAEFGVYVNPGANGAADFDAYCLFYDTLDPDASPVNSAFIAGFFIEARGVVGEVAYTTGPIDLTQIFPGGLVLPDDHWFVDLRFYQPGSTTELSQRATPMFSGSGVSVGSSQDTYWRDDNENASYDSEDARFFGGPPHLANFYLALDGIPNPAPCACDFNRDHALNSQDFFDFLTPFFANDIAADFNADTVVNSQDFFDFLTCFFTGCA